MTDQPGNAQEHTDAEAAIGPVLVGDSYTELLTAIATVLDKENA